MVGVPTSNRCDNCRKRKKKCDERKPSCSECIRGGWPCPGYKPQWKFVDESPRLAEYYAGRKYVYDAVDLNLEEAYSRSADKNTDLNGILVVWNNVHSSHSSRYQTEKTYARPEVPRYLEFSPLGSALIYCLEQNVKGTPIPLRYVGSFFDFIPGRLGRNAALDDAISCLCAIYCRKPSASYYLERAVYQSYAKALSTVRKYLGDSLLRMEPETLCASILLQMCELIVNEKQGDWSQLARGTALLINSRGAHRYKSAFEHAMLMSQLSYILGQSVWFREHCFLRSPEWKALLIQNPEWPFHTLPPHTLNLRSQLCSILVDLPSLIAHCSIIDNNETYETGWENRLDMLSHKVLIMRETVKAWLATEAEPLFLSYTSSSEGIQEQIQYPDIILGVLDSVSHTALLTIHHLLHSLVCARLRLALRTGHSAPSRFEPSQLLEDSWVVQQWRQRAMQAFAFVQGESELAAKPLDVGMRQIQLGAFSSSINI